jgi:hypothetical protein
MATSLTSSAWEKERQLWWLSFAIAVAITFALLLVVGFLTLHSQLLAKHSPKIAPKPKEQVIIVMAPSVPPTPKPAVETPPAETKRPSFTRTSADQASAPPEKADFIGERDTIATSDALPVAGAPNMPSQAGRDPRRPGEIETTESRPQDGKLESTELAKTMVPPTPPTPATTAAAESPTKTAATEPPAPTSDPTEPDDKTGEAPKKMAATSTTTLPGDQPVERPKPDEEALKPQPASPPATAKKEVAETPRPELPKPTPKQDPNEPGFRGNQTKTKLSGSITRKGRSALNVANTPMGRYHSALSRAVEAEWHRNCTKYRDFITPGIITVRFVIAPDSTVRTISVVEMVDAGEVQKGFTLSSIRQAKIPAIPAELKAEIDDEPIELIYNFYF